MIRGIFNLMSVRERFLAAAFIWVIAIVWLSAQSKDWKAFASQKKSINADLATNQTWFDVKEVTELGLKEALSRFDPAKTYSDDKLAEFIDLQARKAGSGLRYNFTKNNTQRGEIFNIHSRRINVKDASIEDLIEFDRLIKTAYPYIGLEKAQFVGNKSDYRKIDAQFIISSFELKTSNFGSEITGEDLESDAGASN